MVERGVTPQLAADELAALGFRMIVYPLSGPFAAARALEDAYGALRRDGRTRALRERLLAFDAFNDLVGLDAEYALDAAFRTDEPS